MTNTAMQSTATPQPDQQNSDPDRAMLDSVISGFLATHDPTKMSEVEFRGARYDAGLGWVHFPKGFGGLGLRPEFNSVIDEAVRKAGAGITDPSMFFMNLAGPTILTHGNDEQKNRFLRPMFTGEERWCQLFSEPGAGSDLAGLATKAELDGDEWIINGQKVWNTLAHLGDWGMLPARTNPDQPKHKGMTYFAVPMRAPGVEVRPLRQITGEAEFNEVYLTDVRVPDTDRIGAVGEGWRASLTTLMNERVSIGGGVSKRGSGPIGEAVSLFEAIPADQRSAADRDQLMKYWCRSEAARLTNKRAAEQAKTGNPGPEGSIGKLASAELNKEILSFCVNLLGPAGLVDYDFTFRRPTVLDPEGLTHGPRHAFLRARANSIEGGTSEIMRNILGEQVLGLPGEPRVDKELAWSKVPRS